MMPIDDNVKQISVKWNAKINWKDAKGKLQQFISKYSSIIERVNSSNSYNKQYTCTLNKNKIVPTPNKLSILNVCVDITDITIKNISQKRARLSDD